MAADSGYITICFVGDEVPLQKLGKYIADKIEIIAAERPRIWDSDDPDEDAWAPIDGWSFLAGYDPETHELNSELITCTSDGDTSPETLEIFCKELVQQFPEIAFSGRMNHSWLISEGPSTEIEFLHLCDSKTLYWKSQCQEDEWVDEDDGECSTEEDLSIETEAWSWNADSGETKERKNSAELPLCITSYELNEAREPIAYPYTIPIEGTAYIGRNERIEHVQVGDTLILKADWDNPYYLPVAVEVFDTQGGSLGFLKAARNHLVQIAEAIDIIQAKAASVTPLSKRRKNAKYALLDVEISIKQTVSDCDKERIETLEKRSTEAHDLEAKRQEAILKAKAQSLAKIGNENLIFPELVSLQQSSIRMSRIKEVRVGDILELKASLNKNEVAVLNSKGEILGLLPCGSFGYICDEVQEGLSDYEIYERMVGYCEIIAVYNSYLQTKVSSVVISSTSGRNKYDAKLDVEISWKS